MSRKITLAFGVALAFSAFGVVGCNGGSATNINITQNPIVVNPRPRPTPTPTFTPIGGPVCPAWGCGPAPVFPVTLDTGSGDSFNATGTKDTDLQRAESQEADFQNRAQAIADEFQMSVTAATQLTSLGDTVRELTVNGQSLTPEDRTAITNAALNIAGITSDDVNQAISQSLKGDNTLTQDLLTKAAANLGMPSAAAVSDKLLPAFGLTVN